jgi:hypothetical protein
LDQGERQLLQLVLVPAASDTNGFWHDFLIGLGAGIVAGLIVAGALWISKIGLQRAFLIASRLIAIRQVVDLSGTWESCNVDEAEHPYTYRETVTLKQKFTKITGKIDYYETPREPPGAKVNHKSFKLRGTYREGSLAAYYRTEEKDSTSLGSISMRKTEDKRMDGGCVYYDEKRKTVVNDTYYWTRE